MYNVFLMLENDFVKIAQCDNQTEAIMLCDKLNSMSVEPIYYYKPMKTV